jgi:hypothetical protein
MTSPSKAIIDQQNLGEFCMMEEQEVRQSMELGNNNSFDNNFTSVVGTGVELSANRKKLKTEEALGLLSTGIAQEMTEGGFIADQEMMTEGGLV